ncbi:MAG: A/G-specific adenine glycosylase [Sedimentisphaerales bacterium]|nr:A/G-specific adenine glycosylase [Sedimentisphaerales bacterium]
MGGVTKPAKAKSQTQYRLIRRRLLQWFDGNARDLPWRSTRDPYAIWISEIMLQQTRVETVKPYYLRFLKRFPTVEKLARARIDTVLKHWEGLGYYSRARNLHRAAREIVTRYEGRLPATRDELLTLPGIGSYTAGAIASIAFAKREPVVDGNVTRVLCRLFCIRTDPKQAGVQKQLWSLAAALLPRTRTGDHNQALMELGSEICLPRNPRCNECPLVRTCEARRHGQETTLPVKRPKKELPTVIVAVGVIYKEGRVLIDKRKPDGLLGGLWEFPGGKQEPGESLQAALHREVREELGIRIEVKRSLMVVHHAYSHFRVRLHVFECTFLSGKPRCRSCTAFKWVLPNELHRYAFPAANHRIIQCVWPGTKATLGS